MRKREGMKKRRSRLLAWLLACFMVLSVIQGTGWGSLTVQAEEEVKNAAEPDAYEANAETLSDDGNEVSTVKLIVTDSDGNDTEEVCQDLYTYLHDTNSGKYQNAKQTVIQLQANDSSLTNDDEYRLDDYFGKNVILDLNGHSIVTNSELKMDKGILTIRSSQNPGTIQFGGNSVFGLTINPGAKGIIEDGVTLEETEDYNTKIVVDGDAEVKGGTIRVKYIVQADDTDIKISGGTFEKGIEADNRTLAELMAEDYTLVKSSDGTEVDLSQTSVTESVKAKKFSIEITSQPSIPEGEGTVADGYAEAPVLTVEAKYGTKSGDNLTYQWYRQITGTDAEGNATVTDVEVEGETKNTFQIPTGQESGSYTYFCRVAYGEDTMDSDTVTFAVVSGEFQIDINGSPASYVSWDSAMLALQKASQEGKLKDAKVDIHMLRKALDNGGVTPTKGYTIDFDGAEVCFWDIMMINGQSSEPLITIQNAKNVILKTFTYFYNEAGPVFCLNNSTLTAEDDSDLLSKTEAPLILENNVILRISGANLTNYQSGQKVIDITGTGNVIVVEHLEASSGIYMAENAEADIYYKQDTYWFFSLDGITSAATEWFQFTLPDGMKQEEALPVEPNKDSITMFEGNLYGKSGKNIVVGKNICSYVESWGDTKVQIVDYQFTMKTQYAYPITLLAHTPDAYGVCANCGKTDLATAYANGHLHIEGLEGRTYDSYPQILSKVTLDLPDGTTKELTKPVYSMAIGVGGDAPTNADAEYTTTYTNNTEVYTLTEGQTGFDQSKAPQVTIKGSGDYTGEITVCFMIGKGTARMGDLKACGANGTDIIYDGKKHKAWNYNPLIFDADPYDKYQFTQLEDEAGIAAYIPLYAELWYDREESCTYQIEYSTDEQQTWIVEKAFGREGDMENPYMITDAGSYPFYIRITSQNDSFDTIVSEKYVAKITPRSLSADYISLDVSEDLTAYYTGKPVVPDVSAYKITDSALGQVLIKDTDFTVSGSNNTDITDDAALIFTGKGNYTGEVQASNKFAIQYAFSPAQTTASTDHWYNGNVAVNISDSDDSSDTDKVVFTGSTGAALSDNLTVYTSLEDAINGSDSGYIFTEEGRNTQTLYIKDEDNGYISAPVEVEVMIDKTAPNWGSESEQMAGTYGIIIKDNKWYNLLDKVSFSNLYNDTTLDVRIIAQDTKDGVDKTSGVDKYYYYVQEVLDADASGAYTTLTAEQLDKLSRDGSDATQGFVERRVASGENITLQVTGEQKNYVIYAYAVDKAGNVSTYVCSEGIVQDNKNPSISVKTTDAWENDSIKDTEATMPVELDEDAELLYFYADEGEFETTDAYTEFVQNVESYINNDGNSEGQKLPFAVKEDGMWKPAFADGTETQVTASGATRVMHRVSAKTGNNNLEITGLQPRKKCTVWIAAIDRAGNISYLRGIEFTTAKAMPKVTAEPVLTGVYGDTAQSLKVTADGKAMYDNQVVAGTWTFTDADNSMLEMGSEKKYEVTFTPDDTEQYELVVVKVIPIIQKRPITIYVQDMRVVYGEELPKVSTDTMEIAADGNGKSLLVGEDDASMIADTLTVKTQAKKGSAVGNYTFTVVSDSEKYDVTAKYCEDLADKADLKSEGTLTIQKAPKAPNMPEASMDVDYTQTTVGTVTLPTGWKFEDADIEKKLEIDVPVTVTANYVGEDAGNYEVESVEITLTRKACTHPTTKWIVDKEATVEAEGSRHKECTVCKTVLATETIAKLEAPTPDVTIRYTTHVQTYGWQGDENNASKWFVNGKMAGTSGKAKRLEGIKIRVYGNDNLGIQYTTHCQSYGWLPWSANGEMNGTEGEAKRLEAIKIQLTGADKDKYDVYYRVHAQSYGWLGWAKNGAPAGTAGYAKRLEGIQIVVVKKGSPAPGVNFEGVNVTGKQQASYIAKNGSSPVVGGQATSNTNPSVAGEANVNVAYRTHVQTYGWQGWKYNGQMSGTSGQAKRLEGINIKLTNKPYSGSIVYTTHVQTYGWQGNENNPNTWFRDGAMAGTSAQAKRLEAIRIALTGEMAEHYDVYYRVHAQSYGWLGWTKNGEAAGTAGLAKRLEGIQIVLVPKGGAAPANNYGGVVTTNKQAYIKK